jgi:hypothetical protein
MNGLRLSQGGLDDLTVATNNAKEFYFCQNEGSHSNQS